MQQNLDTGDRQETPTEFRRRRRYQRSPGSSLIVAIVLITAGALLFLDNIGILSVNLWDYWPVILIAVGLAKLTRSRQSSEHLWGVFMIVFGALFLLGTLNIVTVRSWDRGWPISLLLIALGCVALIKTVESNNAARPRIGYPPPPINSTNPLDEHAVFGSVQRRYDNDVFPGGNIQSVFGHVEVDLRGARNDAKSSPVRVHLESVFGSIKLRVPQTWKIEVHIDGVFGSLEDKTIPVMAAQGLEPVRLLLTGNYVFGSVEIDN